MNHVATTYDRAAARIPQRFRPFNPARAQCRIPCPLRREGLDARWLIDGEGPHGLTWLAVRGDTVRLCNSAADAYHRLLVRSVRYRVSA